MRPSLLLALAGLSITAAPAAADELLSSAPGAVNLAAGGGYAVWAQPNEDTGWHLVVRAPDGAVTTPHVAGFPGPPEASVGTGAARGVPGRPLLAVYARAKGASSDLYALDLRTGREHLVSAVSTARADELAPSVQYGRLAFVRRGGSRPGVYVWSGRGAARRLSSTVATQTAISEGRVAYATARTVVARPLSGRGGASAFPTTSRPRSLVIDRYHVGWLQNGGRVFQSGRLGGSGSVAPFPVRAADRRLAPATQSIALRHEQVALSLDPDGLHRLTPALTFGG